MTYEEALQNIESFQRFGSRPGLERIRLLLEKLGNPQDGLNFVHVAGTNGKGTTCTLIASVLSRAGYRTGLFVSPHVADFRERMQIDAEMVPRDGLARLTERVLPAVRRVMAEGVIITEFELITAMALLWFSERRCDIVVLEVGLGGRFDATNVITNPLVSVITSISLDHTKILGDTLGQIAFEKCGILKEGRPAVCYPDEPPEALEVIRRTALARSCPLTEASGIALKTVRTALSGTELEYRGQRLALPFLGMHQVKNAVTALAALEVLRASGWDIPDDALAEGVASARMPARLELLSQNPPVLLDGAHNPEGTAALAETIKAYLPGRHIVAVMGMLADKDVPACVQNLSGLFSRVIATEPESPRALPAEKLAGLWNARGVPAQAVPKGAEALRTAFSQLEPGGALVLCGSLYLAGNLRCPALEQLAH